jgi:hypothetical protein
MKDGQNLYRDSATEINQEKKDDLKNPDAHLSSNSPGDPSNALADLPFGAMSPRDQPILNQFSELTVDFG